MAWPSSRTAQAPPASNGSPAAAPWSTRHPVNASTIPRSTSPTAPTLTSAAVPAAPTSSGDYRSDPVQTLGFAGLGALTKPLDPQDVSGVRLGAACPGSLVAPAAAVSEIPYMPAVRQSHRRHWTSGVRVRAVLI